MHIENDYPNKIPLVSRAFGCELTHSELCWIADSILFQYTLWNFNVLHFPSPFLPTHSKSLCFYSCQHEMDSRRKHTTGRHLWSVFLALLIVSHGGYVSAFHHGGGGGEGSEALEVLLAAGILAKLLHRHHHHHGGHHPIPIPIPMPVHHGGGHDHEVIVHGHHGHHGHHRR